LTLILICLYAVIHLLRCVDYTAFSHCSKAAMPYRCCKGAGG